MSNLEHKIIFRPVEISHHDLPYVMSLCIGIPTENKIDTAIQNYKIENHKLIGAFNDNLLIAVIGLEMVGWCYHKAYLCHK